MGKKGENDYFQMFINAVDYSCKAAASLKNALENFSTETLPETMESLHALEHAGDGVKHDLMAKLTKEFMPPIEREDIVALAQEIDNVTDAIEDVLLKIYMYDIQQIPEDALRFAELIFRCCQALKTIMEEFRTFKKSNQIHQSIIAINALEEEGDKLYMMSVRSMFINSDISSREVFGWTEVFSKMERCCDSVEHTANVVESVIMKNS